MAANQIKKKFIGNDQVDGTKIRVEDGQAIRAMDGVSEVELIKVVSSEIFVKGFKLMESSGLIDSARLPSYVDDVLEYANFAALPVSGETGKIYITLDDNKQYRWSGTVYVQITSGAIDSVNGQVGTVVLDATDIQYMAEAISVESKLSSLDTDVSALQTNDGIQDAAIATLQTDVSALQTNDAAQDSAIAALQANDSLQDAAIIALQGNDATHDSQIAALQTNDAAQDSAIANLQAAEGIQDAAISALQTNDAAQDAAISALQTNDAAQDVSITNLQAADATHDSQIAALQANDATQDAQLGSLSTDVSALQVNDGIQDAAIGTLQTDVSALQTNDAVQDSAIASLQSDVTALQNAQSPVWIKEKFVLAGAQTSVTLSQTPVASSTHVFIDRVAMHEGAGEDYQISGTSVNFEAGSPFADGDIVYVRYQYLA